MPDVAILDVKLDKGDNDGIELLSHIKSKNKDVPVIIITGHANIEMAVNSLKHGAFEFVEKPFDQARLLNFITRAIENLQLKKQNKDYENKLFSSYDLIGDSKNIEIGDSGDLRLYHDGSNSYIDDVGTGSIITRGSAINIQSLSLIHI